METYSLLREFADSWVLLAMFAFFLGAAIWAFLPSQADARKDASMIPFRNETAVCSGKCKNCACAEQAPELKGQSDDQ
jgi:cytochrome c oxidase cbb3-type subunit 4